jgi:hypothetical protein
MPPSTQSDWPWPDGIGRPGHGGLGNEESTWEIVKVGERPIRGTYRKGVTRAAHEGF